jgi:GNAT superfamily N-acetyltransferase
MNPQKSPQPVPSNISIRPLLESDLPEADRIFHLAFGTFLGLPDPMQFYPDRDYIRPRWKAVPSAAFAAEVDGQLIGSNLVSRWGSVGVLGPLTVHPNFWNRGVASRLLEPAVQLFDQWGLKHAGLFTFPHSTKHVSLYQKFGFCPRFLTALMSKEIQPHNSAQKPITYSSLTAAQQTDCLKASRDLTNAIYPGLDLQQEILAVAQQRLGDTVLLWDDSALLGFALCHCGPGTEAGAGTCYIKFAAARPGPLAAETFDRLIDACESLALQHGLTRLEAGVNLARHNAHQRLIARGLQTRALGIAMHRPNDPGYNRPDVYVVDDWR